MRLAAPSRHKAALPHLQQWIMEKSTPNDLAGG